MKLATITLVSIPMATTLLASALLFTGKDDVPPFTTTASSPATFMESEENPTAKFPESAVRVPEPAVPASVTIEQPMQSMQPTLAPADPPNPVHWMITSRAIAARLGTLDERFQGAAYEIGKFVQDHSIDIDALDLTQLAFLNARYAELWNRRVEDMRGLGEYDVSASLIESTEANYREIEHRLAQAVLDQQ